MKKYIYPLAVTAAMLAAASCDDNEILETPIPDSQKEMISFSLSAETGVSPSSITRAGFDGGNNGTSQLYNPTHIVARISSSNTSSAVRHTKTLLKATYDQNANDNNEETRWNSYSTVDYATGDNNRRFWDDAFGRDAHISIYAVAVPNYTDVENNGRNLYNLVNSGTTNVSTINTLWQIDDEESNNLNEIQWMVSTTQTAGYNSTIEKEDLCYSHNIQSDVDAAEDLNYGKGKNGVRVWGKYDPSDRDPDGYPMYKYSTNGEDKYPTLDDGTMQFRLETGATTEGVGHFDKGHMIFRHALARITVNLVKDDGFKTDGTDFGLTNNVILLNMHYNATLNFKTGKWSAYTEGTNNANANINMASVTTSSSVQYSNFAQVIPGYTLGEGSNVNVMKFTVSDNTYYVTQKQLYAALNVSYNTGTVDVNGNKLVTVKDNKIALEQGKNYVFTIKVKKTGISSVTASLVPWVYVNGETTATNDYVEISIQDAQNTHCTHFDLYRMNDDMNDIYAPITGPGTGTDWTPNYNWFGDKGTENYQNYCEKATLSANGTNVWKTNWFWESNKSFYHFRTVNTGMTIQENNTVKADYFNIYGGPIKDYSDSETTISTAVDDGNVNDYHWGAPFKTGTIKYDENYGFSANPASSGLLYPAIGSTSQQINIIEHHMMSNVHVILKTTKDETKTNKLAEGSVDLTDAEVTLTNFCNSGKVEMGRGLITPCDQSSKTTEKKLPAPSTPFKTSGDNTETNAYSYRVVPQPLHRGTTASATDDTDLTNFIGLTIQTKDANQYYVIKKLSEIKASEVKQNGSDYSGGNQTTGEKIERWYPGYDYTYVITISKKGIESITCTIVDWITVKGDDVNIDLES